MRALTRRAFVTGGGASALVLALMRSPGMAASKVSSLAAPSRLGSPAAPFTSASFRSQIATPFNAQVGARQMVLTLTAVNDLAQRTVRGKMLSGQQFSLQFSGTLPVFAQDTYALHHPRLGNLALFLVPVGQPKGKTQSYEAIVNNAKL